MGKASYDSGRPWEMGAGHSAAWSTMPGTPDLPPGARILGQSYRLDAYPARLVETGTVAIEFMPPAEVTAAATHAVVAVYFWDGQSWSALPTTIRSPAGGAADVRIASAPSQASASMPYWLTMRDRESIYPGWRAKGFCQASASRRMARLWATSVRNDARIPAWDILSACTLRRRIASSIDGSAAGSQ